MLRSTTALNIISFCVLALQINCQNVVDVNQPFQCVNSVCFFVEGVNMSTVSSAGVSSGSTVTRTVTAVGCLNTFNLYIWKNQNIASSQQFAASDLRLCKDRSCRADKTSGIGGAWQQGADLARQCCMNAPSKRKSECDKTNLYPLKPFDTFACAIFNSIKLNSTRTPFLLSAVVNYVPPLTSDIQNSGLSELCFCFGPSCPSVMSPICVQFQVQHCSTCLTTSPTENSLSALAKLKGTHWTQIYSSSLNILDDPGLLHPGQLIRLGPSYKVASGDTLMSIALKFGVSVNQLFVWNQHLVDMADYNPKSPIHLSRNIKPGDLLCVLPKTCLSSFGTDQPVFNLEDGGDGIARPAGGSWADPKQVP